MSPATPASVPGAAVRRYLRVAEKQPVLAILSTDWRNRPPTVKRYPRHAAVALPSPSDWSATSPDDPPPLELLSRLLSDSYGLIRYRWDTVGLLPGQRGGGMLAAGRPHRSVASAGGLYPSELYLVTGDDWGGGRPAAVLHYDPAAHALDPVRPGDWRDVFALPARTPAPGRFCLVVTSVFARTAFKYHEFGFRLQCLDAGVLAGQLLTGIETAGLKGRVRLRFDDDAVAALLGVDIEREAPLLLIEVDRVNEERSGPIRACGAIGYASDARQPSARTRPGAVLDSVPLTRDLYRSARTVLGAAWPPPVADAEPSLPAPVGSVRIPDGPVPALSTGVARRRTLDGRFGTKPIALGDLAAVLDTAYRWSAGPPAGVGLDHLVPLCVVHRVVGDPDLLILDEPTAAMDVAARRSFWDSMREFTAQRRTVLFSTHYLEEADAIADRIILLADGRVVADGPASAIRAVAGARTLRFTLSGAEPEALGKLPSAGPVTVHGAQITIRSNDSDRTLRALLSGYPKVADIEITAAPLADAVLTLTESGAQR